MQATKKPLSPNRQRLAAGKPQIGRKVDTTKARKPIQKREYELLMSAASRSVTIKHVTRRKLRIGFTLLYLTGCRVSEIVRMTRSDMIHMIEHNEYSLSNDTKTGVPRLITFDAHGVQARILQSVMPGDEGYLFARNGTDRPMSESGLTKLMNGFIHRALGELYSTHSFREGYITAAHRSGLSLEHIRHDIAHQNIATTARYTVVTDSEISRGKTKRAW